IDVTNQLAQQTAELNETTKSVHLALVALRNGDSQVQLPQDWPGIAGKVADAFNQVVEQNVRMSQELARLRHVVGKEGKLKERANFPEARGFWRDSVDAINALIGDLVHPTYEVARVIGAVAEGDLSKSMALEADDRPLEGEFLRTAKNINKIGRASSRQREQYIVLAE